MKRLLASLLLPSLLLAYQPANPPQVLLQTEPAQLTPTHVVGIVPAVIVGGAVIAGAGWLGIKLVNRILGIWENQVTNKPPAGVAFAFTVEDYPE